MNRFARLGLHLSAIVAVLAGSPFASTAAQAACEWDLNGTYNFYQNNGITVTFNIKQTGAKLSGDAKTGFTSACGGCPSSVGPINGTISGNQFSFTVNWNTSTTGEYEGSISDQGSLSGTTHDSHGNGTPWHEYYGKKAICQPTATTPPSSAASTPPSGGPPPMTEQEKAKAQQFMLQQAAKKLKKQALPDATVLQDDDVYAEPGGVGKPIGMLRKDSKVSLLEARSDQWCHVQGNAVPTGSGWVWCAPDFLQH